MSEATDKQWFYFEGEPASGDFGDIPPEPAAVYALEDEDQPPDIDDVVCWVNDHRRDCDAIGKHIETTHNAHARLEREHEALRTLLKSLTFVPLFLRAANKAGIKVEGWSCNPDGVEAKIEEVRRAFARVEEAQP